MTGCATPAARVGLSDAERSRYILGRWYEEGHAIQGKPPLGCDEIEFRSDGSCTHTRVHWAYDRDDRVVRWRVPRQGRWQIAEGRLTYQWEPPRDGAGGAEDAEILHLDSREMRLKAGRLGHMQTFYRRFRVAQ